MTESTTVLQGSLNTPSGWAAPTLPRRVPGPGPTVIASPWVLDFCFFYSCFYPLITLLFYITVFPALGNLLVIFITHETCFPICRGPKTSFRRWNFLQICQLTPQPYRLHSALLLAAFLILCFEHQLKTAIPWYSTIAKILAPCCVFLQFSK